MFGIWQFMHKPQIKWYFFFLSIFFFSFQDRVILGTDYPFPLGEVTGFGSAHPGKVIEECNQFDDKLRQKLLFENGMSFLGLNSQDYI